MHDNCGENMLKDIRKICLMLRYASELDNLYELIGKGEGEEVQIYSIKLRA